MATSSDVAQNLLFIMNTNNILTKVVVCNDLKNTNTHDDKSGTTKKCVMEDIRIALLGLKIKHLKKQLNHLMSLAVEDSETKEQTRRRIILLKAQFKMKMPELRQVEMCNTQIEGTPEKTLAEISEMISSFTDEDLKNTAIKGRLEEIRAELRNMGKTLRAGLE